MQLHKLTPGLSVSPQLAPTDMDAIRAAGFRSLICNRPDGEGNDQPLFSAMQQAAEAAGIEVAYLPVESGKVDDEQVQQFAALFARLPKPVLAYMADRRHAAVAAGVAAERAHPAAAVLGRHAQGARMDGAARTGRRSSRDEANRLINPFYNHRSAS
jgi:sulfide:quinone oxidoreductase